MSLASRLLARAAAAAHRATTRRLIAAIDCRPDGIVVRRVWATPAPPAARHAVVAYQLDFDSGLAHEIGLAADGAVTWTPPAPGLEPPTVLRFGAAGLPIREPALRAAVLAGIRADYAATLRG